MEQRKDCEPSEYQACISQAIYCRGYSGEDPPLPIPNREVKLTIADGTDPPVGRVGSRGSSKPRASRDARGFFCCWPLQQCGCRFASPPPSQARAHFRFRTRARTAAATGFLRPFGQLLLRCRRGFPPAVGVGWLRNARENVPSLPYTEEGGHHPPIIPGEVLCFSSILSSVISSGVEKSFPSCPT